MTPEPKLMALSKLWWPFAQWLSKSICCLEQIRAPCQGPSHVVLQSSSSGDEELCVKLLRDNSLYILKLLV